MAAVQPVLMGRVVVVVRCDRSACVAHFLHVDVESLGSGRGVQCAPCPQPRPLSTHVPPVLPTRPFRLFLPSPLSFSPPPLPLAPLSCPTGRMNGAWPRRRASVSASWSVSASALKHGQPRRRRGTRCVECGSWGEGVPAPHTPPACCVAAHSLFKPFSHGSRDAGTLLWLWACKLANTCVRSIPHP